MKLCVFDFDSTLMDGETIDILAMLAQRHDEVAAITEQAMRGELDFFEALTKRVALIEGLSYSRVVERCKHLRLMPGALETTQGLKQAGYKVVIFSGGFRVATHHFAEILGVDADFANFLHYKNDRLTGLVGGEMMHADAKGQMLQRLQSLLGIDQSQTVTVGDGANDLSMFRYAGTKIAFCAKPVLREAADIVLEKKDLRGVLECLR